MINDSKLCIIPFYFITDKIAFNDVTTWESHSEFKSR
jgi:hypothetical protein